MRNIEKKRKAKSEKLEKQRDKLQPRIEALEQQLNPAHQQFNKLDAQYNEKKDQYNKKEDKESKKQVQQAYDRCQKLSLEYLPIKSKHVLISLQLESDTLEFVLGDTLFHIIARTPLSPHVMQLLILHHRDQLYTVNNENIPPLFYAFQSPGTLVNASCILANSTHAELMSCIKPNGDTLFHEILALYRRLLDENDGIGQQACVGLIQQLVTLGLDISQTNAAGDSPLEQMVKMDTSLMCNTLAWIYIHYENLQDKINQHIQSINPKNQGQLLLASKCVDPNRSQPSPPLQSYPVEGQNLINITVDGNKHTFPVEVPDYYPVSYAIEAFKASDQFLGFTSKLFGEPRQVYIHMCPVEEKEIDASAPNNPQAWIEALFLTEYDDKREIRNCLYHIANAHTLLDSALAKDPVRDDIAKEIVLLEKHIFFYEAFKRQIIKADRAYRDWCSTWNQVNIDNQVIVLDCVSSDTRDRNVNTVAARNFYRKIDSLSFEKGINHLKERCGEHYHDIFSKFLFNQFVIFCQTNGQFIDVFLEMAGKQERPIFRLQPEVDALFNMDHEDSKDIDNQLDRLKDAGNVDPYGLLAVALARAHNGVVKGLVLRSSEQRNLFNQVIQQAVRAYKQWLEAGNIDDNDISEWLIGALNIPDFQQTITMINRRINENELQNFDLFLHNQFFDFCNSEQGGALNVLMGVQRQRMPIPEHERRIDEAPVILPDEPMHSAIAEQKNHHEVGVLFKQACNKAIDEHRDWHEKGKWGLMPRCVSFFHHHGQDSLDRGKQIKDRLGDAKTIEAVQEIVKDVYHKKGSGNWYEHSLNSFIRRQLSIFCDQHDALNQHLELGDKNDNEKNAAIKTMFNL